MFYQFFFFQSTPFLLSFFYSSTKNIIKINNKKNNYLNQLLRLRLLKYTHTHNIYKYIYIHIAQPSLPKKQKDFYNNPDGGPHGNSQGIGAVNSCRKDLHPRDPSYPRFSSFLCKYNLTKS